MRIDVSQVTKVRRTPGMRLKKSHCPDCEPTVPKRQFCSADTRGFEVLCDEKLLRQPTCVALLHDDIDLVDGFLFDATWRLPYPYVT
jgi:hypothetical protein